MASSVPLWPMPRPLRRGDRVSIAAPSSAIWDETSLNEGIAVLESWGLAVNTPTCQARRWGYLAGTDSERFSDLSADEGSALLACARGGWGSARLWSGSLLGKTTGFLASLMSQPCFAAAWRAALGGAFMDH